MHFNYDFLALKETQHSSRRGNKKIVALNYGSLEKERGKKVG
jgi:hypothetical protein